MADDFSDLRDGDEISADVYLARMHFCWPNVMREHMAEMSRQGIIRLYFVKIPRGLFSPPETGIGIDLTAKGRQILGDEQKMREDK